MKDRTIFIKNIYYMLTYAFKNLRATNYERLRTEEFDHVHNLLAAIIEKGVSTQLKRGLYCEYHQHQESLSTVRGKIVLNQTISERVQGRMLVNCDYDELTANNLLNQILKSTMLLLLKQQTVATKYKAALKRDILLFSSIDTIDLKQVKWSRIKWTRENRSYQMLMTICQLVVEGMLLTNEAGEYFLSNFIDEQRMAKLYEKFVLNYYDQQFASRIPGFTARASQIPWSIDDANDQYLPVMQTDITLTYHNQVLVIDTKYYQQIMQRNFGVATINSNNLYQIFTYVKNKTEQVAEKNSRVAGMLLYAKTTETHIPNVKYQLSGNQISVKALDLNQEFTKLTDQLDQIVFDHFDIKNIS